MPSMGLFTIELHTKHVFSKLHINKKCTLFVFSYLHRMYIKLSIQNSIPKVTLGPQRFANKVSFITKVGGID